MDDLSLTQIQIIKELSEFSVKNNLKTAIQVHLDLKTILINSKILPMK